MGHYASEMDPNWNSAEKEIRAWQKAGFKTVYLGSDNPLECPVCASLVVNWRKHSEVCKK